MGKKRCGVREEGGVARSLQEVPRGIRARCPSGSDVRARSCCAFPRGGQGTRNPSLRQGAGNGADKRGAKCSLSSLRASALPPGVTLSPGRTAFLQLRQAADRWETGGARPAVRRSAGAHCGQSAGSLLASAGRPTHSGPVWRPLTLGRRRVASGAAAGRRPSRGGAPSGRGRPAPSPSPGSWTRPRCCWWRCWRQQNTPRTSWLIKG